MVYLVEAMQSVLSTSGTTNARVFARSYSTPKRFVIGSPVSGIKIKFAMDEDFAVARSNLTSAKRQYVIMMMNEMDPEVVDGAGVPTNRVDRQWNDSTRLCPSGFPESIRFGP